MNGIKKLLFGIALILIGGFFIISTDSSLGGYGELLLFILGLYFCITGVRTED